MTNMSWVPRELAYFVGSELKEVVMYEGEDPLLTCDIYAMLREFDNRE